MFQSIIRETANLIKVKSFTNEAEFCYVYYLTYLFGLLTELQYKNKMTIFTNSRFCNLKSLSTLLKNLKLLNLYAQKNI